MVAPSPIITASALTKHYGARVGLSDVDLRVPEGALYGFLGPNGAGKTTAIRLLLGFLRPTAGRASVFGLDAWRDSARIKRDVGYLPSDLRLYPWMTLSRALRVSGKIRGVDLMRAGGELADRFLLDADLKVRKMSRGMRQKVGIVLTLAHDPRLLIMDEPTSGLDPLMQDELASCLRERAVAGKTVFFSSHTLSEVEQLCDHIAVVREGRIAADQDLNELRGRARRSVTLVFDDPASCAELAPPPFLAVESRSGDRWSGSIEGSASDLVQWAAAHPIRDVSIAPPDLESLFRSFYRTDEDSS